MLQIQFIRENKEEVVARLAKRNMDASTIVEEVISLDEKRRSTQVALDTILAESNKVSKDIGELMRNGEKAKAELLKSKTTEFKEQAKELTETLNEVSAKLEEELYKLPNTPAAIVPNGKSAEENECVFQEGEIPTLHQEAMAHWDLIKKYDIIDFELGTKITAPGFPVYKGKGAKLQRALISYFLDKNIDAGY